MNPTERYWQLMHQAEEALRGNNWERAHASGMMARAYSVYVGDMAEEAGLVAWQYIQLEDDDETGRTIRVEAKFVTPNGEEPEYVTWNWGDGSIETGGSGGDNLIAWHTYDDDGNYTVVITAVYNGRAATDTRRINIPYNVPGSAS